MNLNNNQMIVLATYVVLTLMAWVRIWRHPEDNARPWQIVWSVFCACFPIFGPLFFFALVEMPPPMEKHMRVHSFMGRTDIDAEGVPALFNLLTGKGGVNDPEKIAKTVAELRRLAAAGDPQAQTCLGTVYAAGLGMDKDLAAAVTWFRKAADQGFAKAQAELGAAYFDGMGIAADEDEAYFWLRCAELGGEDRHADIRHELQKTLAPEKLITLRHRALDWKPTPPV